jgi:hypothetical protein
MMALIGEWLRTLLRGPSTAAEDRMDESDRESSLVIGGLSRLLAEILAKLEASFGDTPLDVEISYEADNEVGSLPAWSQSTPGCLADHHLLNQSASLLSFCLLVAALTSVPCAGAKERGH